MSAETEAAQKLAERAVIGISNALGVDLDPATIIGVAGMMVGAVGGAAWKAAHQAGLEAAANITSLEQAEAAAKALK